MEESAVEVTHEGGCGGREMRVGGGIAMKRAGVDVGRGEGGGPRGGWGGRCARRCGWRGG